MLDRGRRRISDKPRVPTPIGARSTGHCSFVPGSEHSRAPEDFYQFYWSVSGSAVFHHGARRVTVGPHSIFCYPPRVRRRFVVGSRGFEHYWWTLDGPLAGEIIEAYGLTPPWPRPAGPPPVDLFQRLFNLLDDVSLMAEREACVVTQSLLLAAATPPAERSSAGSSLKSLIEECASRIIRNFPNSDLAISALAEELGVNRSWLSQRFREAFGLPPHKYLKALRMRHALKLLAETDLSVADIGEKAGYADASYFTRCVKSATGQSPSEFRHSHQQFIEGQRIGHALKLLVETDLPISAVARRMGYPDTASFSQCIKVATGQAPVEFRAASQGLVKTRRIDDALRLLAETDLSLSAISRRIGYKDASALHRNVKKATGKSPTEFRKSNQ